MSVSIEMTTKDGHPHGEQLSAYVDGMLDVAKTRSTAEDLRACAACRAVAEDLRGRESAPGDLASYLEGVRRRRPINQIMSEAELNDAGRDAAIEARRRP